ncbi:MAG: DNA-formamidopyrimidine glycosylase [Bacilli bacterium]|jgi:formamidopyrimidine-DNA glycosylase
MPELPEVETIKNILRRFVLNKAIADVIVLNRNTIEGEPDAFVTSLKQKAIDDISRVGKFLIFHLGDIVFLSHLRMEGKYYYHDQAPKVYDKHACVIFYFSDGSALEYNDTRKFGLMKLDTSASYRANSPLSKLGPEPFEIGDVQPLLDKLKKKTIPIKAALLDQSFISGLGNIYVDEVLYKTKIHPETPANLIAEKQMKSIVKASVEVLNMAIESGGSTIRSYHPSQGIDGGFQAKLNAYGRENLPCPRCHHPLRKMFVGGRGTTFCPQCQKNPALPFVLGITGPIGSGKSSVLSYYADRGFLTLSGDAIVAKLYDDIEVRALIQKLFGLPVINDDGTINKQLIIDVIIADPSKKRRLEKILHPLVEQAVISFIKKSDSQSKIALEMPLLFESKIDDYCNVTLYVDIDREVQKQRLKDRRSPIAVSLALNAGFDAEHNKQKATFIVDNSSTLKRLQENLDLIIF